MRIDKTCMSYWFPKLLEAGLPVPRTTLLTMPREAQRDVFEVFDGKELGPAAPPFFAEIAEAAEPMGYPFFLRTGYTSGKHDWERTCFVPSESDIPAHVIQIIEFSECADMIGLPYEIWAVREMLPTIPIGICSHYGKMPICQEFRFFAADGVLKCWHPYWPEHALEDGDAWYEEGRAPDYATFCNPGDDLPDLINLACAASRAVSGAWSVDLLHTTRGWFITDMAEAHKSFHWEGCKA